jgi:hypothetical protein
MSTAPNDTGPYLSLSLYLQYIAPYITYVFYICFSWIRKEKELCLLAYVNV